MTVWWFDHEHPTLFTYVAKKQSQSRLQVVIDANVLYELDELPTRNNQSSHSLLADWLDVELCLNNEIFNEINRQDNQDKRERSWKFANGVSQRDINQEIMAFRFSGTELFGNPIHRDELQKIWIREKGKNFNIPSPVPISNDIFLHLYGIGTQIQCKKG